MKKTLSALALSAVSAISGYASANQLSFSYAQGETSHIQNQRIEVLDSIDTFFDYIADRGDRPPEETPAFNINYDFAETPYIAIHHGARKSSGYSLVPTKIVEKADRTVIFVEEQYPDEATCFNTLSATYPYALIQMRERMPFGKPFEVRFMKKAVEC